MPTWICDAPIGSAVFVAAFGGDGSDVAVAEFDVLFAVVAAAAVVAKPAAALDVCTELAAAVAVDAAVVAGCNTVDRIAVVVDVVAAAAGEHNALDTVAAAAVAVVVVGGGYTGSDVDIVAVDDTVAADGRTVVDGVNCRTCCYRGGRQLDSRCYRGMEFRTIRLSRFAVVVGSGWFHCCCCWCWCQGEVVHYTGVDISRWTRASLAGSNHWFATWARSNCGTRYSRWWRSNSR